ncbi:protein tesmin/TSO1-like CXC 2 [Brassica napus]|uniref:CRC domain-containing protein n=1 Tax=Brassica oleracea var. oleracea TaxID=109376 RepID=A0A0D3A850_BRAOL|nr:PREDICTED: protein tesmin/TSO1-like CXC 2 [Brassica oleracea var. oleracea]XP_013668469.1 protein tesmin/TSO1-like CXC 2 [Brassica napus]
MDTPQKSITQIETPVSKSRVEDSPVFNYINSLSPIRPVKSIPNPHQFSALNFTSPPSVFTSPHLTSSHKESRFFKTHHPSPDPTIPVQESPDDSTSNEGAAAEAEVTPNFNIDASTEMEQPHIAKETNLDDLPLAVSPCGRETTGDLSLVPYASPPREENGEDDTGMEMYGNVQGKNETPDWDRLIADSSEFLIFSSPNDSEAFRCLMMQRASPSQAPSVMMPTMQPGSINEPESSIASPYGAVSVLHRGIRRRCLDFEMPGNKQTSSENNTSACGSSSRCVVPSIGLHLNALLMSTKDCKTNNTTHDYSCSEKYQVGLQGSSSTLQETLDQTETETRDLEDVPVEPTLEELHLSSPKKKRVKLEAGEGESCKRCNCKKSKCLKLYCECFAAGVYCIEPCSCIDCFNKPIHEDTVLATRKQIESRNPLAFAPKVIKSSDLVLETGDDASKTPASARHKRGCNCKKSNCLKKYCECFQGGVGCSINCRCEGCKNAFGRKDGSAIVDMEAEQEEENETSGKNRRAKTQENSEVYLMRKEESSALPATPMSVYRQQLVQLKNMMPPPQSVLGVGSSSSGMFNSQYTRKLEMKSLETVAEDGAEEMPEILSHSSIDNVNAVSPNGKRVSPPHLDSSSSGRRSGGRKLILQSIPTFPSLTPQH